MAIVYLSGTAFGGTANGGTSAGIDTTGASFILIWHCYETTPTTLSDNQGNTWTSVAPAPAAGSWSSNSQKHLKLSYIANPITAAAHTFTVSGTGSQGAAAIQAFSGTDTASPVDQKTGANDIFVSSKATGSITPSQPNCLISSAVLNGGASSVTNNASLTETGDVDSNGGQLGIGAGYLIQGAASAVNVTWTYNAQTTYCAVAVVSIFEGATPPTPTYELLIGDAHRPYPFKPCGEAFRPLGFKGWR